MPIQILSPQLANQIAAGEVVERPASVVKELVENSLDAGANRIQIDIENGGASLIRVRDNGFGIPKAELALALARHATSKISHIDDLDAILSLGFRGEALASISSVSRLTLTSRTQEQSEAWQVYAQGLEMETTVKPASHPVGTTVEVENLFFNTPARRKFLRSDKTEFAHIDEVIRRIALAKSAIAFTLTHNGKVVRQYRSALDDAQKLKRVAAICGDDFIRHALQIQWKHEDLHLSGWVASPTFYRAQNDLNYSYVNGRMVRDKVINHTIRQAYAEYLGNEQYPAFVLFLDLNPNEVDVNVHPTKHEVRFHQSRLIHDFICQGIINALSSEQAELFAAQTAENVVDNSVSENKSAVEKNTIMPPSVDSIFEETHRVTHQVNEPTPQWTTKSAVKPNRAAAGQNIFADSGKNASNFNRTFASSFSHSDVPSKTERQVYRDLLQVEPQQKTEMPTAQSTVQSMPPASATMLCALAIADDRALLLQQGKQFYLLPLNRLQQVKIELSLQQSPVTQHPLLIPLMFRLNDEQWQVWLRQKTFFAQAGFEFNENEAQQRITLNRLPLCLRRQNLQKCVIALLDRTIDTFSAFLTALCAELSYEDVNIFADAVNLLTETEQLLARQSDIQLTSLLIPIDWRIYLDKTK
ncbi:DNA mismatch repair endonuclease MutL [Caviibacterium pharyngocola]|uniref:DNA mismatch repair protein MutL n=1 Tax=Caviibacterium pharyngocola TaxID=28159 RepID=A0A2M8RWD0_9PAST|nr:DNA mismatch repair endonuclease MutL [Caviibacterium pharyngocola]PJG83185.1 DNA mismatch repair endonuclease MutL [Caviibacterium pharyngocola]